MSRTKTESVFTGYLSRKVREKAVQRISQNCASLLDVACGNGLLFTEILTNGTTQLFGLDVSRALLRNAREKTNGKNVSYVEANALAMPCKSNQFECVSCLNTTINLKSEKHLQKLILELTRLCQPNGRIIFDIRNGSNIFLKMKYAIFSRLEHFPIQGFTVAKIRAILNSAGFEISERIAIGFPLAPFAWGFVFVAKPKNQVSEK